MKTSLIGLFGRYATVGVLNTLVHWLVFFGLIELLAMSTAWANLSAFCVAVTFSFFMNAHFTFSAQATGKRYLLFIVFMGALSFGIGWLTDQLGLLPLVALVSFSFLSLVLGFLYSRYVVFAEN